jgi:hypothetical protein
MWIILAWGLFFSLTAWALEPGDPALGFMGGMVFQSEIDNGDSGDVEQSYAGLSAAIPFKIGKQSLMELKFSGDRRCYSWNDVEAIEFGRGDDPWKELLSANIRLKYVYNQSQSWSFLAAANIGAAWEKQTEDSYAYGGLLGAIYRTSPNMSWMAGISFTKRPEENLFFPFLGMTWGQKAMDGRPAGWSVKIGAPETEIRYSFNDILQVYWNAEMDMRQYRLDEDSDVSPSGILEITGLKSGLFADINPMKPLRISLGVNYLFEREWEIQDKNGDKLWNTDIEDSFGVAAALNWTF